MIKKPRPTSPSQIGSPEQSITWEDIIGKNLMRGDYNPLRGVVGMSEDYNAALTGYRQTPTGLEQEPGFARALTLMAPGTGGGPSKVAAAGILRLPAKYSRGKGTFKVLKNPTKSQIPSLYGNENSKALRYTIDPDTGDTYVWNAFDAIHYDVFEALGLDKNKFRIMNTTDFEKSIDPQINEILKLSKRTKMHPFEYQDAFPEKIIHERWDTGNEYRYVLEGAGDILREFALKDRKHGFTSYDYIGEKLDRIYRFIYKSNVNELKNAAPNKQISALREAYMAQPTHTEEQKQALELINTLLDGNWPDALAIARKMDEGLTK